MVALSRPNKHGRGAPCFWGWILAYGLALVLVFIGSKMLLIDLVKIPIGYALLVTAALIAGSIFLSMRSSSTSGGARPPQ